MMCRRIEDGGVGMTEESSVEGCRNGMYEDGSRL
jgi:hypothetical protein